MDSIVETVVSRWKMAAGYDYMAEVDEVDLDAARNCFKEDTRLYRAYRSKCLYLAPIFHKLAEPLETPKIEGYAIKIEKRVADLDQLMSLIQGGMKLLQKAQDEFDNLLEDLADPKSQKGGLIEAVLDLPSIETILKIAKEGSLIQDRLVKEDDDIEIDWTLEEYLGSEARVSRKIEKNGEPQRGWMTDGFGGVNTLYGFVKYFLDPKYIQNSMDFQEV